MLLRVFFISAALLVFTLFVKEGVEQYRKVNQVSIVLLTVESLRQDMVRKDTTPHLLKASKEGYRSVHHRAVSGWTGANMISLLSGLSPFQAGVHTRGQSVQHDLKLPLKILSERGYRVAGLQGFMTMDLYQNLGLDISDVGSEPLFWLTQRGRDGEPFFLWEHYVHTHLPYKPGSGYEVDIDSMVADKKALARVKKIISETNIPAGSVEFQPGDIQAIHALQEANIREFDDWFARFWDFFNKSGLSSRCILVITADHGDEHGERGSVGHASTNGGGHLHEEIVRVPFFIWLPDKLKKPNYPQKILLSSHLDVGVTLLSLLDIPVPKNLLGQDLFNSPPVREWYGMTSSGGFSEKDPYTFQYYEYSLVADEWKILWRIESNGNERIQLYNLSEDPGEQNDLANSHPLMLSKLQNKLEQRITHAHHRPIELPVDDPGAMGKKGPAWVFPDKSALYSYDDFAGKFYLQWRGDEDSDYVLQYQAGQGDNALNGQLKVHGLKKDFGKLSKRYWQTWIVPASPIKVRVRQSDHAGWSEWLILEATP